MAPPLEVKQFQSKFTRETFPDRLRAFDVGSPRLVAANVAKAFIDRTAREIERQIAERGLSGRDAEISNEYARYAGRMGMEDHGGGFAPNPVAELSGYSVRAGLDSKTATTGAELQFLAYGGYVGPEAALGTLLQLATIVPSDQKMAHVKQTGTLNPDVAYSAENPGSDVTGSDFTLSQVTAAPHPMTPSVKASMQLLRMSPIARQKIAAELLRAINALIEREAINGSGSAPHSKGILNDAGITTIAMGTNGAAVTAANVAHLRRAVAEAGAELGDGRTAFLTTPAVRTELQQLPRGTGTDVVWHSDSDVFGEPGFATTNVPSNLTKGTSTTVCHAALYGEWGELYLHVSPQIEIIADTYTFKKQGMVEIAAYLMADSVVPRPKAFAAIKDILVPAL